MTERVQCMASSDVDMSNLMEYSAALWQASKALAAAVVVTETSAAGTAIGCIVCDTWLDFVEGGHAPACPAARVAALVDGRNLAPAPSE